MRLSTVSILSLSSVCGLALSVPARAQDSGTALQSALGRVYPWSQPPTKGGGDGGVSDAPSGPDVSVGELMGSDGCPGLSLSISTQGSNTNYWAYGIGTTSCNVGTANVEWIGACLSGGSNRKPVIPQNIYKLSTVNGSTRFEQVGQSWVKHAFTALTCNACLSCNGQGGSVLGIGCSDPYTASRNASQSNPSGSNGGTGPRYQINPFTGDYPWPLGTLPGITDTTSRRARVLKTDLVATNTTSPVQFIAEAIYVTRDDARYGNGGNNASYRRLFCTSPSTGAMTLEGTSSYNSGTHRQIPAIYAWRDFGNIAVNTANPVDSNVIITQVGTVGVFSPPNNVPTGDGFHLVGSRATDLGNGTTHYEYAVYNMNSDRMGGSFSVPLPPGAVVTNAQWKGVDSHSGIAAEDTSRNEPWDIAVTASAVTFSAHTAYSGRDYIARPITSITTGTTATVTSAGHGLATGDTVLIQGTNAMISAASCAPATSVNGAYRVTVTGLDTFTITFPGGTSCNVAGSTGTWGSPSSLGNGIRWGTLYNFRFDCNATPSSTGQVTLGFYKQNMPGFPNSVNAAAWVPAGAPCYANCDNSGIPPIANVADFTCFLQKFAAEDPYANCDGSTDVPVINVADFTCFLQKFAAGCP